MNLAKKITIMGLSILIVCYTLFGADKVDLRLSGNRYIQQLSGTVRSIDTAQVLGLTDNNSLSEFLTVQGENGTTHVRSRQLYRGVPVYGEHIIISRNAAGQVLQLHGRLTRSIEEDLTDVTPSFSTTEALEKMKSRNNTITGETALQYANEKSELSIFVDAENRARLVYVVSYFADIPEGGQPVRPYFIVDAHTGEVIEQWEGLTHDLAGTGPGGNAKIGKFEYGTDFGYLDVQVSGSTSTMNSTNVKTVDLNHGTSGSNAYSYSGYRNTRKEINGAYSPLNDAHYYGEVVYNMFQDYISTPPLTFQLTMRVHYSNNYENAFWDGSAMTFGDGGSTFYPLVCLDVAAHEVSHGFTEQNSGLEYKNQSGGINEAFSDMAGEAAEYYMKGRGDFMVGSDIFKGGGALRYMDTPTKDGRSIDHASDYTSGMDVHFSSGVYNKAFYLLAVTSGWDIKKAFQLFALANRNFWTPTTTFQSGAVAVYDAALELGFNTSDVIAAFNGVGIFIGPVGSLADALDNNKLSFSTAGDGDFTSQTADYYYDGDAARSGKISHNQESSLETTVTGPCSLSFYWKVSSESGYDYLRVKIDGVEQDKISGSSEWAKKTLQIGAGSHTVSWIYTKDYSVSSGQDAGWIDKVETESGGTSLADAVDAPELTFTTGGDGTFFIQSTESTQGGSAVQSPAMSHNQSAWIETTLSGAGTFSFDWKVSSESGYDFLIVTIDGKEEDKISGNSDWSAGTYSLGAGSHTIRITYSKDYSVSSGSDCGYLDNVQFK